MLEILKPGLETSIQELPGRIGYWEQGFPPSGPVDSWSFRLANRLVGNHPDAAALECQFTGSTLKFGDARLLALAGADMSATLDGQPLGLWQTHAVKPGQVLELNAVRNGVRCYIAISGAIDTPLVLGSRATFHMAGVGGMGGYAIKAGQHLPLGPAPKASLSLIVPPDLRPQFTTSRIWEIECVLGPNDDWLTAESVKTFLAADWKVQSRSNRTGMRLTGPAFQFSARATNKRPEHGQDPSNILDHGYPLGAVNLAGQTPIILLNDAPSTGGFINPFTVASAAFWKLGQTQPNETLRFRAVSVSEAQQLRQNLDQAAFNCELAAC